MAGFAYAAVTPVRNDYENLARLAESLEWQTVPPSEWIIVDNGSTDGGLTVAHELAARLTWARVLEIPGEGAPRPGAPIVRAFHAGLRSLSRLPRSS